MSVDVLTCPVKRPQGAQAAQRQLAEPLAFLRCHAHMAVSEDGLVTGLGLSGQVTQPFHVPDIYPLQEAVLQRMENDGGIHQADLRGQRRDGRPPDTPDDRVETVE